MILLLTISAVASWILLIMIAIAVLALYRHFGQLYMNKPENKTGQGPEVGSSVLSFGRKSVEGKDLYLPDAQPTVLVFADTDCELCAQIRDELAHYDLSTSLARVLVLCSGRQADVTAWARPLSGRVEVVWDQRASLASRYEVNGTPFAIVVDGEGVVAGKSIINGRAGIDWALKLAEEPQLVLDVAELDKGHSIEEAS